MRNSPTESATLYKIGTQKRGNDDYTYFVVTDKNKKKKWMQESCLFIIYDTGTKKKVMDFGKFPPGWWIVGSGTTFPIDTCTDNVKYPLEIQFNGNPTYVSQMKEQLKKKLTKFQDDNIIKRYRIVSRTGLINYIKKAKSVI